MSVRANPTTENVDKHNRSGYIISPESLKEAMLKVVLPMNISYDYREELGSIGTVTRLFESEYNGLYSIGAEFELKKNLNVRYLSIGFRVVQPTPVPPKTDNMCIVENLEVVCFSAFWESGYDDISKIRLL
jgi:hypothetical protein